MRSPLSSNKRSGAGRADVLPHRQGAHVLLCGCQVCGAAGQVVLMSCDGACVSMVDTTPHPGVRVPQAVQLSGLSCSLLLLCSAMPADCA